MNKFSIDVDVLTKLLKIVKDTTRPYWEELAPLRNDLAQHIVLEEMLERQTTEITNLFINDVVEGNEDDSIVISDIRDLINDTMMEQADQVNADSPSAQVRLLIESMGFEAAKEAVEKIIKDNTEEVDDEEDEENGE